jgi:hypothetical protein
MYTTHTLHSVVNKALYDNDRNLLWENAGYIRELKDVFLVGQSSPIVQPFIGDAVHSLSIDSQHLTAFSRQYEPGQALCWASFTSMSDAHNFHGCDGENVIFRICCGRVGQPSQGQYFPSLVKAFSAFAAKQEVIFPPHSFLRVINVELKPGRVTVFMETIEYIDVWTLIKDQDWTNFEIWATHHPEMVDTRSLSFSMIGTVAESISRPVDKTGCVPNPFDVCMRYGADVNEFHEQQTPYTILEKKLAGAIGADRHMYEEWLSCLRHHGAMPTCSAL